MSPHYAAVTADNSAPQAAPNIKRASQPLEEPRVRAERIHGRAGLLARRLGVLATGVGIVAAVMWSMTAARAAASVPARSHRPTVIRPQFRYVAEASWMWTGARYALAGPGPPLPGPVPFTAVTVIDDQSGQARTVGKDGCYPVQLSDLEPAGLPWVPFNCSALGEPPAPALYAPATGQWLAVSPSPAITNPSCTGADCDVFYSLAAAGRYWLAYQRATCMDDQHCSYRDLFQNIQTGELRQDPSGAGTTVDLNAPTLTRRVCRPVSVPSARSSPYGPPGPGSLIFYGSFALAIGTDMNGDPKAYLERCGTHLHRLLTGTAPLETLLVGANAHEVVWTAHPGAVLSALTLPGLQPFTLTLPKRLLGRSCSSSDYLACATQIGLTNRRLYLLTASDQLWAAPNPSPAERQHR